MQIKPKNNLLLIKKHTKTALKVNIDVAESEDDKRLITGEILESKNPDYKKGETVIFGKYALLRLTIKGVDYYFLDVEDIVGTASYKE